MADFNPNRTQQFSAAELGVGRERTTPERTTKLSMRTRTFTARTVAECLQLAKQELGVEAMILSKRTYRKGAVLGRFGGREMIEVTFGTYRPAGSGTIVFAHSHNGSSGHSRRGQPEPEPGVSAIATDLAESGASISKLEERIAGLAQTVQNLVDHNAAADGKPTVENLPAAAPAPSTFVESPLRVPSQNDTAEPAESEPDSATFAFASILARASVESAGAAVIGDKIVITPTSLRSENEPPKSTIDLVSAAPAFPDAPISYDFPRIVRRPIPPIPNRAPESPAAEIPADLTVSKSVEEEPFVPRVVEAVAAAPTLRTGPAMPEDAGEAASPRTVVVDVVVNEPTPIAVPKSPTAESHPTLMRMLLNADVSPPIARKLIAELPPDMEAGESASVLRSLIADRLLISPRLSVDPGREMKLLMFLGPTGVGKTTTVAKVAAQYALIERQRVGIVTADTYRIAATMQMQTYGEIMRVQVKVAQDRAELVRHLTAFREEGIDLVLIDTPGRSPNDLVPLGQTAYMFDGMGAIQRIMTLSATTSFREMDHALGRFAGTWRPDSVAITKLDEVSDNGCYGRLLTLQAKYSLPLSYMTTGQKVPDDLASPDPHAIAARILLPGLV